MRKPVPLLLVAATPCALALTACGPTVRLAPLPADLTHCAAEPEAPELAAVDWSSVDTARVMQVTRDRQTLEFVLALRAAGADCRAKVAGAKAWNEAIKR